MGKILAISGKATSGKTTAARFLAAKYKSAAAIESFATPLKIMVAEQFSYVLTPEDMIHNKNKVIMFGDKKTTVRQIMIDVGQLYRKIDPDFWVKKLLQKIEKHGKWGCPAVFIDDMRFPNEYLTLKKMGASLVRIERPGIQLIEDESETGLDFHPFDHTILNDGTVEQLYAKLECLAKD